MDISDFNLSNFRRLVDAYSSRQYIADSIKCDVSTITKHYNGDRKINAVFLIKYSKFFNVSTDYLLGISNYKTTKIENIDFYNRFDLKEQSIDSLLNLRKNKKDDSAFIDFLDYILSNEVLFLSTSFCNELREFKLYFDNLAKNYSKMIQLSEPYKNKIKTHKKTIIDYELPFSIRNIFYIRQKELTDNKDQIEYSLMKKTFELIYGYSTDELQAYKSYSSTLYKIIESAVPDTKTLDIQSIYNYLVNDNGNDNKEE